MFKNRLNSLALLSVEKEITKNINIESAKKRFADLAAEKIVSNRLISCTVPNTS